MDLLVHAGDALVQTKNHQGCVFKGNNCLFVAMFIIVNEGKKHLTGKGAWLPPNFDFCMWDNNEII